MDQQVTSTKLLTNRSMGIGNASQRPYPKARTQAKRVLELLAAGHPMSDIEKLPGMPSVSTVVKWTVEHVDFRLDYQQARQRQAEVYFDQLTTIADTPQVGTKTINRTVVDADGEKTTTEIINYDMIEHRKLRIETRKWWLSKVIPKLYGERVELHNSGAIGVVTMTADEFDERAARMADAV